MLNLAILYPILLVVLIAVAIYVQVTSSILSLPISTGTTVLTIVLPLLAAANVFGTPILRRILLQRAASSPAVQQLLPVALQLIQGVLAVVLATIAAQGFAPGQGLECRLEGNWQRLVSNHDDRAIERIQDAFNCCGLRSIKDRDFPRGLCRTTYKNRHDSCLAPWRATQQRSAGFEFAVAVTIGILQLIHLSFVRLRNSRNSSSRSGYRRIAQSVGVDTREEGLLENGEADGDENRNGTTVDDETNGGRRNDGAAGDGPNYRVEPSSFGDISERENWR